MFVRGLQGSYNLYAPKFGVHVPHGDLLVFGLCCGQIMYAWLVSPETIPREYNAWSVPIHRARPLLTKIGSCKRREYQNMQSWQIEPSGMAVPCPLFKLREQ
jgi:hypothetical protein